MSTDNPKRPGVVEDKHLEYLDSLRESGDYNMAGAAGYIQLEFYVSRPLSRIIANYWMHSFGDKNR